MRNKYFLGFSVFLEHLLYYDKTEEKARPDIPPEVQLGGSSFNIAKSLEALGVPARDLLLAGKTSLAESAHRITTRYLLDLERMRTTLLPVQERAATSYYLIPRRGETWAFGYPGGKILKSAKNSLAMIKQYKEARIRIITELSADPRELELAKEIFKKNIKNQINVLIPSQSLILSKKAIKEIIRTVDLLACNAAEAKYLWGKFPTKSDVLKFPVPYIFITRGGGEAWLKVNNKIYSAYPQPVRRQKHVGGAGDAATAVLVFSLFIKNKDPLTSLRTALSAGRKVLLSSQSYLT